MSKSALSSLGIYVVIIVALTLLRLGFIHEYSNSAFDIRNVLPMTITYTLIAGLFIVYRRQKVQPNGFLSTANHVVVTAVGWCALVAAALGIVCSVLLGAFMVFVMLVG